VALGADVRSRPDNQPPDKHVESRFVTCLDGGSSPPSSTEEEVRRDLFLLLYPRKNVIKRESNPCKEEDDAALQIHFLVALSVSAIHFLVALLEKSCIFAQGTSGRKHNEKIRYQRVI